MARKGNTRWSALWQRMVERRESVSTVLMGFAAVITTWCAFENTKWSGIQTVNFNRAAAARVESTRNEITENQRLQIDLSTFLAWLQAVQAEHGPEGFEESGPYKPDPLKLSGFLFQRFRAEFRPVVQAWVETRPLRTPGAPSTPFAMEEYRRPMMDLAVTMAEQTKSTIQAALEAKRIADSYMLTTVIAALVVFFAGLSTKLAFPANGVALLGLAWLTLIVCVFLLIRLPMIV